MGIDPKLEPRCSPEEADYLVDKLDKGKEKPKPVLTLAVWLAVAKQPVVWGMALCTVIKGFGEPVFLTYVPQYLVTQHNFDLKSAGLIGSLPLLSGWIGNLVGGVYMDGLHLGQLGSFKFKPWRFADVRRFTHMTSAVYGLICTWILAAGAGPGVCKHRHLPSLFSPAAHLADGFGARCCCAQASS